MNPQDQIKALEKRIKVLEDMLKTGAQFEETIRDIIFVDIDNTTSRLTQVATDSHGDTVTIGKIPTKFIKIYFKGQIGEIPFYIFT